MSVVEDDYAPLPHIGVSSSESNTEHYIYKYGSTVWPHDSFGSFPSNPENSFENFDSSLKWVVAASIVSALIGAVALVAIVYAIIACLKKAGDAIPTYLRVSSSEEISKPLVVPAAPGDAIPTDVAVVTIPLNNRVLSGSQCETATVEKFIHDLEKEKPTRFSPGQLEVFTKNYATELGKGGYGVVYKGEFPNGVEVAVKVLSNNRGKKIAQQFMAEVSTIGRTYHKNLVRLYGFCFDITMRALVYEFMENGSLDKFLFSDGKMIQWEDLHEVAVGTAKGIAYLHEECEKRIIHYDIKPENVLLDVDFCPKVADFGLAKLSNRESTHVEMTGFKGTPGYAAPELWQPYPVTCKCDVYSFGMLLFEIIGRRRNFDVDLDEEHEWQPKWIWENFDKGQLSETMELCGIEEKDRDKAERMSVIALWCVQYLPTARPIMSTVVKMLEGMEDISPPPNPFSHLGPENLNSVVSNGSETSSGHSTSTEQTSETSHAVTVKRIFEIEKN